ncbi:hypothetical protein [Streptomyces nigra]|uniref:hypothetical protein n=1 Tax=Streptomyces nigra TaxID=1827580 RepID=UPI00381F752E
MQIAGVDIYVNHPVLHLGATDWVPLSLALDAASAASCDTHVAVRVRPQSGLIKVRLFTPHDDPQAEGPDAEFTTVFDGPLLLPDGRLAVGDVEQLTRFLHRVGDRGQFNVRVAVNTPGPDASAIDIVITGPSK